MSTQLGKFYLEDDEGSTIDGPFDDRGQAIAEAKKLLMDHKCDGTLHVRKGWTLHEYKLVNSAQAVVLTFPSQATDVQLKWWEMEGWSKRNVDAIRATTSG